MLMEPFTPMHITFEGFLTRDCPVDAFGILTYRFDCLLTTPKQLPDTEYSIEQNCLCLHNFMRMRYPGTALGIVTNPCGWLG